MQHTQNYQLSRWAKDDRIMMEDFNADNEKIDAALKAANDRIDTKADAAALSEETGARQSADTALGGRVDAEALTRANADSALQASMASQFAAVAANLGSRGHNARIAWGSYTGDGTYGAANPNTLNFDFYPVAVFIGSDNAADSSANPSVLMRGRTKSLSDDGGRVSSGNDATLQITWSDNGVSWYNVQRQGYQNNTADIVYCYLVIGCDKTAEEAE